MILNHPLDNYFFAMITVVVTLNSISIPLSYNIVSEKLAPYLDRNIFQVYMRRPEFKKLIVVSVFSVAFCLFWLLFDITNVFKCKEYRHLNDCTEVLLLILSGLCFTGFILAFIDFFNMSYEYSFNTEEVVFQMIKTEIENVFKED